MKAFLDHTQSEENNIISYWFEPETPVQFTPGQYLRWYLPHANPDARGERRFFTLSSSPTESPLISFTTKFSTSNSSSFKTRLKALKPGDEIEFTGPMGDFVLPKDPNIPLVFVAGGIGCTPFRSIAKWLQDSNQKRSIKFVYCARSLDEVAFEKLFKTNSATFTVFTGRPKATQILDLTDKNETFYLSGPEQMIDGLSQNLISKGIDKNRIITDLFPGYKVI